MTFDILKRFFGSTSHPKRLKLGKLVKLKMGHGKLSVSITKGQEFALGVLKFYCRFKILKSAHF